MKAVKHGVGRLYLIFQIEDNEKQTNGSQKAMYVWFIWLSYWSNHSGNSVGRLKFLAHLTLNIKQDSTPSTMISSVQFSLSCVWPHVVTSWTEAHQASLSITNSWSLLKLMSIELVMPSNHLILCCPLLLLPSIFTSIRVFSNESVLCIRWPRYQSFSFSISPSNEYSGLISFRTETGWISLLSKGFSRVFSNSSKASILWHSAFFIVQLSHPYMTTGKTISLTRWTFVGKVISLHFNMLSRLVIIFFQGASIF